MTHARRILWTLTVSYWVVLFVLTHTPQARLPKGPAGDKTMHFVAYLALSFLMSTTLYLAFPKRRMTPLLVIILACGYGALDELTQPLVGRFADWHDWFADCAGAAAGGAAIFVLQWFFPPKEAAPVG